MAIQIGCPMFMRFAKARSLFDPFSELRFLN